MSGFWLSVACLAQATSASPGASSSPVPLGQTLHVDAVELFDIAAAAARAGRVEDALRLYDALARDPDIEIRSEARFRKGQLLAAHGRFRDAATAYRRLLDEKPAASAVRLELAAVLARLGDETGARRQLRLAAAAGLPPEVADQVARFTLALRSPKLLGGSLDVTVAPDTNVNRGTQAQTISTIFAPLLLSQDARASSGIGLRLHPAGYAKQSLADSLFFVVRTSVEANLYRQGAFDDITVTGSLGIEHRRTRDQIGGGYGFGKRWYGGAAYARSLTLYGEWLHKLDAVTQLTGTASRGTIRYPRNPLQGGAIYDGSLVAERALSARFGVGVGGALTRQEATDPSYASWSAGPSAYAWMERGRTTMFGTLAARRLVGDARNFLFLGKRREWFASARVGAIFRQLSVRGFSPTARLGIERNRSPVSIYDYRRVYGEFGVSRSF